MLGFPTVALAGYTQSGKTTFFNRLVSESKEVGRGPFTTLSSYSRLVRWKGSEFILGDSIGFIEDMHPMIVDAFFVTLDEIRNADLILLFVDLSEQLGTLRRQALSIDNITRKIDMPSKVIVCGNKVDLIDDEDERRAVELISHVLPGRRICTLSAKAGKSVETVVDCALTELGIAVL